MIVVLFGQPHSGKTTLAQKVVKEICNIEAAYPCHIDGDEIRKLYDNVDYSRKGRLVNLQRASDIAAYLDSKGMDVVISLVYPYKEARDYLNKLVTNVKWVYLHYTDVRGREEFHVKDFELDLIEETPLVINTTNASIDECISHIKLYLKKEKI